MITQEGQKVFHDDHVFVSRIKERTSVGAAEMMVLLMTVK